MYGCWQQYEEQKVRNADAGELTELVRDFLDPAIFYNQLQAKGINFFCGVPDSLLKGMPWCQTPCLKVCPGARLPA